MGGLGLGKLRKTELNRIPESSQVDPQWQRLSVEDTVGKKYLIWYSEQPAKPSPSNQDQPLCLYEGVNESKEYNMPVRQLLMK